MTLHVHTHTGPQLLPSGDEDHETKLALTPTNKYLNRFTNIVACKLMFYNTRLESFLLSSLTGKRKGVYNVVEW